MAAESSVKSMKGSPISVLVLVDGTEIPKSMYVMDVEVVKEVNKIPYARIVLHDGDPREQTFANSEDATFEPGKEVEIKVGHTPGEEESIYKGIIIEHGIKISEYSGSSLVLKCKDEALKLTVGRKNMVFFEQTDSDIISAVVSDAGLSADVESTTGTHKKLIQYYATNWDFIQARADANGLITIINDGEISIKKPTVTETAEVSITYGKDLIEMDLNIDSTYQYSEVEANCWDHTTLAIENTAGATPAANAQGDIDSAKLSAVLEPADLVHTTAPVTKDVIQAWADSVYQRGVLSRIRGTIKTYGSSKLVVGGAVELADIGARFNGDGYVTKVRHTIADAQWFTEVGLGLSPLTYMEENPLASTQPAGGTLPAIHGLQHGIVVQISEDPDGEYRVLVHIPIIDNQEGDGVWARMTHYYATEDCGFVFYPEIGDEVVLGFLNDDPTYPVILGSMYSSGRGITTEEAHDPADPNIFKGISINKGLTRLEFADDPGKNIVRIITEDGMLFVLNDDEDSITIEDPVNVNKIVMDSAGITITTDIDFIVDAGGNVSITAGSEVAQESGTDFKITAGTAATFESGTDFGITSGTALNLEAGTMFEVKGSAMGTVDGGGMLTVKGGLVQIN